jgi:beta-xylosidase
MTGPAQKDFFVSIDKGLGWESIENMGAGSLTKGEWGLISGTYTLPADAELAETSVFIETPWTRRPKKDEDLMDFYVECLSVKAKPMYRLTHTMPGENDPNGSFLRPQWQFNHNPDNHHGSLTERPGFLRLRAAYLCDSLTEARNTLTQRSFGPSCHGVVALETAGLRDGDTAGLAALQDEYGYVGVRQINGRQYIVAVSAQSEEPGKPVEIERISLSAERVYLAIDFDFTDMADTARMYYSLDEIHWYAVGATLPLRYKLSHFTGYRFALFYYAAQTAGGHADFDSFRAGRG